MNLEKIKIEALVTDDIQSESKAYLELYEKYMIMEKDCENKKIVLEMDKKSLSEEIKSLKNIINLYKKEADKVSKKYIDKYRNRNADIVKKFDYEVETAHIFYKILWFITKEKVKERKKLLESLEKELQILLKNLNVEELKNFEKMVGKEARELEVATIKERKISEELIKNLEELSRISLYKKFIKSGDKEKTDVFLKKALDIVNLRRYPDRKIVSNIKEIANKVSNKYSVERLKDIELDELLKIKDKLKPELKEKFITKELKATKVLLGNIDSKSLDDQQRLAVVTDEDNNLVVAGAGSGKTLTISAKVKYLIENLGVNPKEILLISFTKKAAEEMQERITGKLGLDVEVKTYHSLGLKIINFFKGKGQDIFSTGEMSDFVKKFREEYVVKDENLGRNIFKYFTTYINNYKDPKKFDSLGEYYRANKSTSLESIEVKLANIENSTIRNHINNWKNKVTKEDELEKNIELTNSEIKFLEDTLKSVIAVGTKSLVTNLLESLKEYREMVEMILTRKTITSYEKLQNELRKKAEYIYENKITLRGERVKSIEELIICNYLFSNSIEYIYEGDYKFETADKNHRQYKPDFYLPKYDIYIEHFGVDEKGRCPQYTEIAEKKYLDGIIWKRDLHKKNGTILEETYSYDHKNGKLILKLDAIFKKYKIPKKELSQEKIVGLIQKLNLDFEFQQFYSLVSTFLSLFKSNGYCEKDLLRLLGRANKESNNYLREKHTLFLKIFRKYYLEYQKTLKEVEKIDFNDMINEATKYIEENKFVPSDFKYKYIIIDEFQDVSMSKYRFVKALKDKSGAKIMAVGDDWQSIYRFTGSEISVFTKFADYFGETELLRIENTYRNSQELIDVAGTFIMKNTNQIKKDLKSKKSLDTPVIIVGYKNNVTEEDDSNPESMVRRIIGILDSLDKNVKSVMLLGRNNGDINFINNSLLFSMKNKDGEIKIKSGLHKNLDISYMTAHKSKGAEADVVIIINNKNDTTGFPNKIVDDSIISYVIKDEEDYLYSEERRLFYVALTRTKTKCYLMCPDEYSIFIEELKSLKGVKVLHLSSEEKKINCPDCKTGYLVKRENSKTKKEFYSCNNYPQCNFSTNLSTAVHSKVRCNKCGSFMTLRKGKYGEFYGCINYPTCKGTFNIEDVRK